MEERIIILTRGIQASGKSTWAEKWAKEKPEERIRFNWDSLRNMFGEYWVEKRESTNIISNLTETFLDTTMRDGWNIVIDNMNLNPKSWKYIQDKINSFNKKNKFHYKMEFKDFLDVSVEECIRRDSMRPNPIGEKIIKQTYKKYRSFIAKQLNTEYYNNIKKYDETKKQCIIVDMDSTLCFNLTGRPFFGKGAAEGMKDDIALFNICHIVQQYTHDDSVDVIILTGREDTPEIRNATEKWLKDNILGKIDKVLLRPIEDKSKGTECKLKIYKEHIEPYYNVLFILEDSSKIVKMWRDNGLVCLQVNEGLM